MSNTWAVKLVPRDRPNAEGRWVEIDRAEVPAFGSDPLGTGEHVVMVNRVVDQPPTMHHRLLFGDNW